MDIFKTFLLGKCCLVRAKIRILSEGKKSGFMKGLLLLWQQLVGRTLVFNPEPMWERACSR
ncbi:hypothetical protein BOO89_12765 [Stutzerimonas stutzeri]|nr:hypothetical protein BOO89_12765 [Stutzerimonas stutzeri]